MVTVWQRISCQSAVLNAVKDVYKRQEVTCEKNTLFSVTYKFGFTPSYTKEIKEWIQAVNKVTVNDTTYRSSMTDDLYFSINATDQQIILHGDKPFVEGNNTVVISAAGYEDLTLTVGKDGTIGGDAGENTEVQEKEKAAPEAESLTFVNQTFGDSYYRLKFNLEAEEDVYKRQQYNRSEYYHGTSTRKPCHHWNWHYNCSRWLDYWGSFTAGYFQICEKQNG